MTDTSLACVCYLGQPSTTKIQDAVRRLNKKNGDARILLALFGSEAATSLKGVVGATVGGGSFGAALEAIIQATSEQRRNTTTNSKDIVAS